MAPKKHSLSFTAVAVGSTFLILLLGIAILMGTLLFQFLNGRGIDYPETASYAQGDLIIRSEEFLSTVSDSTAAAQEAARELLPCAVTVKIGEESDLGVAVTSDGWLIISESLAEHGTSCTVTLSDGSIHTGTVEGPLGYGLYAVSIPMDNLRSATFGRADALADGAPLYQVVEVSGEPLLLEAILSGRITVGSDGSSFSAVVVSNPSEDETFSLIFDSNANLIALGNCLLKEPSSLVSAFVPSMLAADALDAMRAGN